jgi:hypothetical protein
MHHRYAKRFLNVSVHSRDRRKEVQDLFDSVLMKTARGHRHRQNAASHMKLAGFTGIAARACG